MKVTNQLIISPLYILLIILFIFILIEKGHAHQQQQHKPHEIKYSYHVWPHPRKLHMTYALYSLSPLTFRFETYLRSCDLITAAIQRAYDRMFTQDCSKLDPKFRRERFRTKKVNFAKNSTFNSLYQGQLTRVKIHFAGKCDRYPQAHMDESYQIRIEKRAQAGIWSKSVWGVLRALETFSQLVENVGADQFTVNLVEISDSPRFRYRGLMIDTSRHFLPVHSILETLDIMEMNKFNVLHWHLVDDQSFPFVSGKFSELSREGAYSSRHVYPPKDVKQIINYARMRGIRILPEFDTPGHAGSWGRGRPDLLTQCYTKGGKPTGQLGPFEPTRPQTYSFLKEFYREIAGIFPDHYVHLGGDEVDADCWGWNPVIRKYLAREKLPLGKLQQLFTRKLIKIVENLNRSYIVWQDVFDSGVKMAPGAIHQVWIEWRHGGWRHKMGNITRAGHRVILSAPWYLEEVRTEGWRKYYETDPLDFPGTDRQKSLVLGGEACMWGEYADGGNLINKMWTSSAALAEKLWSPPNFGKADEGLYRFEAQHCRLQTLGVRVGPLSGPGFCPCDYAL